MSGIHKISHCSRLWSTGKADPDHSAESFNPRSDAMDLCQASNLKGQESEAMLCYDMT